MIRRTLLLLAIALPLRLFAQEAPGGNTSLEDTTSQSGEKKKTFCGMSGGMAVHIGYAFAESSNALFRNGSLPQNEDIPHDGVAIGLGGAMRIALVEHLHIGGEGYVTTMPFSNGSLVRIGHGGLLIGGYWTKGKYTPVVGLTIGGGATSRTFIPKAPIEAHTDEDNKAVYNASYVKTPFFLLDPYIGFQIAINKHVQLLFKIDYPLPFSKKNIGIGEDTQWPVFVSPSGPRLHFGAMFGGRR